MTALQRTLRAFVVIATVFLVGCAPQAGSRREFDRWVDAAPERAASFRRFEEMLREEDVAEVVANHELWLVDRKTPACVTTPYVIPPDDQWRDIVPTLRFIRDYITPRIGGVRVVSGYRDDEFNACVGGASESAHRSYQALDLAPIDRSITRAMLIERLCVIHAREGPRARVGFGVYGGVRFHIDTRSYRGWGADFRGASFPCAGRG